MTEWLFLGNVKLLSTFVWYLIVINLKLKEPLIRLIFPCIADLLPVPVLWQAQFFAILNRVYKSVFVGQILLSRMIELDLIYLSDLIEIVAKLLHRTCDAVKSARREMKTLKVSPERKPRLYSVCH